MHTKLFQQQRNSIVKVFEMDSCIGLFVVERLDYRLFETICNRKIKIVNNVNKPQQLIKNPIDNPMV